MRTLLLTLITFVGVSAMEAGITFEKTLVEIKAAPDAKVVSAKFPFEIKGGSTVVIKEYEAACSCLTAEISNGGKLKWEPGETGEVRAQFKMENFKGTVDKVVRLRVQDEKDIVLTVRVHVPVLFSVTPQTLFWDQNGKGGKMSFKLKVNHSEPIKILEIKSTNEQFNHKLKTIKEGWEYELEITPTQVETRAFGLVSITTDCKFKKHQTAQAFTVIRRPKPATPKKP